MGDIQRIQDGYADICGISLWICNPYDEIVTKRSMQGTLAGDAGEALAERASNIVKSCQDPEKISEFFSEKGKIRVMRKSFYYEGELLGYCVGMVDVEEDVMSDQVIRERMSCFTDVATAVFEGQKKNEKVREELNKLRVARISIEKENERLQHENDYDGLTQVHSRSYFFKVLEEADKDESLLPISLVVGDVNNLKFTNDMFGHRHGDWLLYKIAQILQEEAVEQNYTVARCGGDEFFIFMPNTKRSGANYYCKRVMERLARENDTCMPPSISLGTAKKSEMSQNLNRLLEVADAKMYAAKSEYKQNQNKFDEMLEIICSRGFLSREGVERKTGLTSDFAVWLDWSLLKIQQCILLARYQDIGLTAVPAEVYKKSKEEYTDREWREIKKHPGLGMKIALISAETAPISEWMYFTHENYDGTGYPHAVKGDAIPQEVRLVRIVTEFADVEEKQGYEAGLEYVEKNAGTLFHPEMASLFLKFMREKKR